MFQKVIGKAASPFDNARAGRKSYEALKSVAEAMQAYALERPALSAAAFRMPTSDTPESRAAYDQMREFMLGLFAECGLHGSAAERALQILRSLVRGFVLHKVMASFIDTASYDESYDRYKPLSLVFMLSSPKSRKDGWG
jgi:hypothetical protein